MAQLEATMVFITARIQIKNAGLLLKRYYIHLIRSFSIVSAYPIHNARTQVLAMILHRYDVRRLPGEEGKDVDGEYTVTLHPIKLKLRFTKRDKKGVA